VVFVIGMCRWHVSLACVVGMCHLVVSLSFGCVISVCHWHVLLACGIVQQCHLAKLLAVAAFGCGVCLSAVAFGMCHSVVLFGCGGVLLWHV